uniref:5'-nucleotidase domain-containing protein 3 n=1 Tax=Echinostoma caproni TaxID=27848 RepID=A0A183B0D4_9TREM
LFEFNYANDFAIRGLHFDAKRGYLMKVDAYHNIQLDTVHLGLTPVSREDVIKAYDGAYVPSSVLKHQSHAGNPGMFQIMDFFMLPEFYLLSCVIESSVARVHKSGLLGLSIMGNPEKYIHKDPNLSNFLNKLVANGKKLFVISNSSAAFIQFRHMDELGSFKNWEGVKALHRGHIYDGGSLGELRALKNWNPQNILYFGDHVYSDLADVANTQGWTTAAVIPELEHEITVNNTSDFRSCTAKLRELERLINHYQVRTYFDNSGGDRSNYVRFQCAFQFFYQPFPSPCLS